MSEPYIYKNKDRVCSMCGDPLYDDMDYCEGCRDHTTAMIPCEECNGTGEVDTLDQKSVREWTISPPYKKQKCNNCNGEGWVEE